MEGNVNTLWKCHDSRSTVCDCHNNNQRKVYNVTWVQDLSSKSNILEEIKEIKKEMKEIKEEIKERLNNSDMATMVSISKELASHLNRPEISQDCRYGSNGNDGRKILGEDNFTTALPMPHNYNQTSPEQPQKMKNLKSPDYNPKQIERSPDEQNKVKLGRHWSAGGALEMQDFHGAATFNNSSSKLLHHANATVEHHARS